MREARFRTWGIAESFSFFLSAHQLHKQPFYISFIRYFWIILHEHVSVLWYRHGSQLSNYPCALYISNILYSQSVRALYFKSFEYKFQFDYGIRATGLLDFTGNYKYYHHKSRMIWSIFLMWHWLDPELRCMLKPCNLLLF